MAAREASDLSRQVKRLVRLTVYVYITLALLIVGMVVYAVVTVNQIHNVADKANAAALTSRQVALTSRKFASENRRRLADQAKTIRFLCDQGYVLDDLVQAALVLVRMPPRQPGADEFIRSFEADHVQLLDGLTKEGSPCAG